MLWWNRQDVALLLCVCTMLFSVTGCTSPGIDISYDTAVPDAVRHNVQTAVRVTEDLFKSHSVTLDRKIAIYITADTAAYEDALIRRHSVPPAEAAQRSKTNSASTSGKVILVNADPMTKEHAQYAMVAHELTHQFQYQMASEESQNQLFWLTEGFADWIGSKVAQAAHKGQMEQDRRTWLFRIHARGAHPPLHQLNSRVDWNRAGTEFQGNIQYRTAGLAVFYLSTRCGEAKLIQYFQAIDGRNNEEVFADVFGMTTAQFYMEFEEYLRQELGKVKRIEKTKPGLGEKNTPINVSQRGRESAA